MTRTTSIRVSQSYKVIEPYDNLMVLLHQIQLLQTLIRVVGVETATHPDDVVHSEGTLLYGTAWRPSATRLQHINYDSARLIINVDHWRGLLNWS